MKLFQSFTVKFIAIKCAVRPAIALGLKNIAIFRDSLEQIAVWFLALLLMAIILSQRYKI